MYQVVGCNLCVGRMFERGEGMNSFVCCFVSGMIFRVRIEHLGFSPFLLDLGFRGNGVCCAF